ncbi:protein of unknown function (plasmid) [Caballeronia sp. S22]
MTVCCIAEQFFWGFFGFAPDPGFVSVYWRCPYAGRQSLNKQLSPA